MIPLPYKLLAAFLAAAAILASVLGYGHRQYSKGVQATTLSYESALAKQKAEASTTLNAETNKVLTAERALQAAKNQQETQDATHQKTITGLSDQLRRAAGVAIRLRDPNALPGCRLGSSSAPSQITSAPSTGTDDRTETSGLLSTDLTGLLQRLTREADEVNNAYASCKPYAGKVSNPQQTN